MINWLSLIFFVILFLLNFEKLSSKINLFDYPDEKRKFQKNKVSLLGGSFFIIFFYYFLLINYSDLINFDNYQNLLYLESYRELFLFLFVATSIFLIGLFDDKYGLSARDRSVLLIFLIFLFLYFEHDSQLNVIRISFVDEKILLGQSSIFFTTLCIFVLIVALNMFDGFNGQSFINFLVILIFLSLKGLFQPVIYLLILLLFIFAYLNFRNKAYLGDSGVYFLGFLVSYLIIKVYKIEQSIYAEEIIIILLIPIVDMVRLFIYRIYNGKNPFLGDTNHIHHIIRKKYGSKVIYFISFLLVLPLILLLIKLNFYIILFIQLFLYVLFIIFSKSESS